MQLHPYHIIQEICKKHSVDCELMPGSTKTHVTFKLVPGEGCPISWNVVGYGSCYGTNVELGIASVGKHQEFDLSQPNSVDDIDQYLSNYAMWAQ